MLCAAHLCSAVQLKQPQLQRETVRPVRCRNCARGVREQAPIAREAQQHTACGPCTGVYQVRCLACFTWDANLVPARPCSLFRAPSSSITSSMGIRRRGRLCRSTCKSVHKGQAGRSERRPCMQFFLRRIPMKGFLQPWCPPHDVPVSARCYQLPCQVFARAVCRERLCAGMPAERD